ncbi:MAG: hypothetical protein ACK56F_16430, partial [bacterium]
APCAMRHATCNNQHAARNIEYPRNTQSPRNTQRASDLEQPDDAKERDELDRSHHPIAAVDRRRLEERHAKQRERHEHCRKADSSAWERVSGNG